MKIINECLRKFAASIGLTLLGLTMLVSADYTANAADSLYIGDYDDNAVKQFDADTGAFQGRFVKSQGGVHFPNGIVFDSAGNLLLSNQNGNTGTSGDILQYSSAGKLLNQIVKNKDAPWAPQGIILVNDVLFVADLQSAPTKANPTPPGTLRRYTSSGVFLGASVPDPLTFSAAFHPRGIVLGPDGYVYVSNVPVLGGLGGQVLRFTTDGTFVDEFISSPGGDGELNRPSGLVFGPDGRLYVTSFRKNPPPDDPTAEPTDNDKIFIYDLANPMNPDKIDLDLVDTDRTYAQALLFGPDGYLFVPITTTGEVRRYDVTDNTYPYDSFVPAGGALENPWFLTFGKTSSSTLEYQP